MNWNEAEKSNLCQLYLTQVGPTRHQRRVLPHGGNAGASAIDRRELAEDE